MKPQRVLIEKTSKSLKLQKVLSVLAFFAGVVMFLSKTSGAWAVILGAGVWYLVLKVAVWWYHS